MRLMKLLALCLLPLMLSGCLLTKVVSVPMRIGGAVVSIVPVVGNQADEVIDTAADVVDEIPL